MSQKHSKLNILHDLLSVNYGHRNKVYLSNRATDNLSFTQRLTTVNRLEVHNGCVNTICWNDTGQLILSGSDDQHLVVVNPFSGKVETSFHSAHHANIFSAKFLPNSQDRQTVSCSADGFIYYCDFDRPELLSANGFNCHLGAVYEVLTIPNDPYTFLSCGEDGTVRWFDLRTKTKCNKANCEDDIMINSRQAVMSLALNPMRPYQLAIGCADSSVRVYDRRQLATGMTGADPSRSSAMLHYFSAPSVTRRSHRITSLVYSRDGEELLVSYSSEHLYLFNFRNKDGENHVPLMKSFKGSEDVRGAAVTDEGSNASASASFSSTPEASSSGECVFRPTNLKQPPVKRLRLRGDWSDTGPNARPERERVRTPQDENAASIMQRMSNMLTRLLEGRMGQDRSASSSEQPSGEEPSGQDPLESTGLDASELSVRADVDVPTSSSSLSSSDASSATTFVSFSTSEQDESGDDSKESYEMAEDRGCPSFQEGDDDKSQQDLSFQTSTESNVARETTESSMLSGNQELIGATVTGAASSSSYSAGVLNGVSFGGEPATVLGSNQSGNASHVSRADVGTVLVLDSAEEVDFARLTASDSVKQGEKVDILRSDLLQKSMDETSLPQEMYSSCRRLDYESTGHVDSAGNLSEEGDQTSQQIAASCLGSWQKNVGVSDREGLSFETCQATAASASSQQLTDDVYLDSDGRVQQLGEKVKSLADCFADVLVTEQTSDFEACHPDLESNDRVAHQPEEGLAVVMPGAAAVELRTSVLETPQSKHTPSTVMHSSQVFPSKLDSATLRDDLNNQAVDSCGGRDKQPGPSSSRLLDEPAGTSDFELPEEDSDSEEAYTSPTSRKAWLKQRLEEKNAAASKLQAVFRQRLEQRTRNQELGSTLPKPAMKQCFVGHRNSRTMIKEATFWGNHYVMSGSDCGHIFIWDRRSAELVMLMEGDRHVVNCLQPHPYDPILASSGIDYDVKIWMPALESSGFDQPRAAELMRRNEIMLEETRDTVTVPASFMLRMLLSLNHARRNNQSGEAGSDRDRSQGSSESSRDD